MTELLQRVIAQLEKLPEEEQDAIASQMLDLSNRTVDGLPSYYGGD
ncbi:hypothetical protein [Coleofasciculus sp. E1-EBD-02]